MPPPMSAAMPDQRIWAPSREDTGPVLLILLIPLLVALPVLLGIFQDNPMLVSGGLGLGTGHSILHGFAYIDPNVGITTQALGKLSIELWLHGTVPWWNPYNGVGMPLAGEYQPAAFSPVNLLLLLPHGIILRHLVMQYIAGLGSYCFIRQLSWSRLSAITCALLFAQNGSLAWLAHAPPDPGCFLPWMLLGLEHAACRGKVSALAGWRLLGIATAAALLSGFPETAYICGLFVAIYAIWRWFMCRANQRLVMARRVAIGAVVGIALAAPQLLAFAEFLPAAEIGGHAGAFAHIGLPSIALFQTYLAPYIFGPIFAADVPLVRTIWANIGGYCDLLMLTLAAAACAARRDSLTWMLLGWIVVCTLKTFAIGPVSGGWNLLPGMTTVAFFRYASSSVEFAVILLVACTIDELHKATRRKRAMVLGGAVTFLIGMIYCCLNLSQLKRVFSIQPPLLHWTVISLAWMAISCLAAISLVGMTQTPRKAQLLAALLVFDATVMFAVPTFSTPRHGRIDHAAISFLQENIGLQRFYTLGPISPNHGAYFQLASINHNYLPAPKLWTDYVKQNLDRYADPITFVGIHRMPADPDALSEFNAHRSAFAGLGVKYLVTPAAMAPFAATPVYQDRIIKIFELQNPAPYFETSGQGCVLQTQSRQVVVADCSEPATLLRRELFYPGWQASINGNSAPIVEASGLFQSISLPAGKSRVAFCFSPPHVAWAWCAFWAAALLLAARSILGLLPDRRSVSSIR